MGSGFSPAGKFTRDAGVHGLRRIIRVPSGIPSMVLWDFRRG